MRIGKINGAAGFFAGLVFCGGLMAQDSVGAEFSAVAKTGNSRFVYPGPDGRLIYAPINDQNDRIVDFSYCGYQGGGVAIPDVPVKVTLEPDPDSLDDCARIQAALDAVAALPLDDQGFRGAVLLRKGIYRIGASANTRIKPGNARYNSSNNFSLLLSASGVVLRGEGADENGTVLRAISKENGTFIRMGSRGNRREKMVKEGATKVNGGFPSGAMTLAVESVQGLKVGDYIAIRRNTNAKWVESINMDKIAPRIEGQLPKQWTPGLRETYKRTILSIEGNRLTVDAPITCAFSQKFGGGTVTRIERGDDVRNVGVEDLCLVSVREFDDEGTDTRAHMDDSIRLDRLQDCWVRRVSMDQFFAGSIRIKDLVHRVTVEDCHVEMPLNEEMIRGGYYGGSGFSLNGHQVLIQRCTTSPTRHPFVVGSAVAGPNAFVFCDGSGASELHHRYSTGVLYDSCGLLSETSVALIDRSWMGSGHGWCAANSIIWNGVGNQINCESPPVDRNWAIGCRARYATPGYHSPESYESFGTFVAPQSLYLTQLRDRLGQKAVDQVWTAEAIDRYDKKNWCDLALKNTDFSLPDADYTLYPTMPVDYRESDLAEFRVQLEGELSVEERGHVLLETAKILHLRKNYVEARKAYEQVLALGDDVPRPQRIMASNLIRHILIEQGTKMLHGMAPKTDVLIDTQKLFAKINTPPSDRPPVADEEKRVQCLELLEQADTLYRDRSYDEAITLYGKVAEDAAAYSYDRSRALLGRANMYKVNKRFDKACLDFKTIIEMEFPRPYDKRIALKDLFADYNWIEGKLKFDLLVPEQKTM
ncbi:MAG: hypothetical protein V5783_04775 [Pontiella sp.]